jgi:hypothetical protein
VNSNEEIVTFNKNSNQYIDMGIYQPGEGRLYKIEPGDVMKKLILLGACTNIPLYFISI